MTVLPLAVTALVALTPAPAAAQMSASAGNVTLRLTIPEGVTKVRGVLAFTVRGIASGWAGNASFQGLAKRLETAIVMVSGGDDLNDNSYPNRCASGEFKGIPDALTKLAAASNHPELAHAPIVGIGHSHGGDYWNWFNACHPARMALVFVHASGGVNYSAAALKTPILYELGMNDLIENGSKKPRAGMFANRGKGAPMSLVLGAGEGHNNVTQQSLDMIVTLIEAIFKLRVPADADAAKGPVVLNEINESTGGHWVGDLYTKEIAPWSSFMGNKARTSFLPSEEVARKWKETGPALPMSITLPEGACGWCGNPKDEPKAGPTPPANSSPPPADAGAPPSPPSEPPPSNPPPPSPTTTPPVDAGASPPPPATTPPGTGGRSGGSSESGGSGGQVSPGNKSAPVAGGCSLTPAGSSGEAPVGSALALVLLSLVLALSQRPRTRR